MYVTDKELKEIREESKKHIKVWCDEYHAHTDEDCFLAEPKEWLIIAKLLDTIEADREKVRKLTQRFEGK